MPIRINLLAEAQAAEDQRRRDPVKRVIVGAAVVVGCVLLWSSTLQVKIVAARSTLGSLESKWTSMEKGYQAAIEKQQSLRDVEAKLTALANYTTNRFLWGTFMNAFQQTMNGVDNLQVVRLKTDQAYVLAEEVKPRTNNTQLIPGRPASSTEKISVTIDAMDTSPQPGANVKRFKEAITSVSYFQTGLQKTNGVLLTSLSAPTMGPLSRQPYVTFSLQCYFPEKTR